MSRNIIFYLGFADGENQPTFKCGMHDHMLMKVLNDEVTSRTANQLYLQDIIQG